MFLNFYMDTMSLFSFVWSFFHTKLNQFFPYFLFITAHLEFVEGVFALRDLYNMSFATLSKFAFLLSSLVHSNIGFSIVWGTSSICYSNIDFHDFDWSFINDVPHVLIFVCQMSLYSNLPIIKFLFREYGNSVEWCPRYMYWFRGQENTL